MACALGEFEESVQFEYCSIVRALQPSIARLSTIFCSFTDDLILSFRMFDLGQIDHLAEVGRYAAHSEEE